MFCPKCFEKNVLTKLKIKRSEPEGLYGTYREYKCPECLWQTCNIERLTDKECLKTK